MKYRLPLLMLVVLLLSTVARAQMLARADTIYRVDLINHDVASTRLWADNSARYHYNQMRYNVTCIMPYLIEATALFNEIHAKLNDPALTGRARKQYIASKEIFVRTRFEEKIKALNETQGVLLIKLAARQTGFNIYQQLADFKGTIPAVKWQTWARIHGFNLNRKYHPEEEPDLEHIMRNLGYPLPAFYGGKADEY